MIRNWVITWHENEGMLRQWELHFVVFFVVFFLKRSLSSSLSLRNHRKFWKGYFYFKSNILNFHLFYISLTDNSLFYRLKFPQPFFPEKVGVEDSSLPSDQSKQFSFQVEKGHPSLYQLVIAIRPVPAANQQHSESVSIPSGSEVN